MPGCCTKPWVKSKRLTFFPSIGHLLNLFVCYKVVMFEKYDPSNKGQKINICLIFELKQEDQVNGNSTCWHLKRKDTQGPALWRAGEARAVFILCPSRTHWTFLPYPSQLWSSRPCRKPGVCHARSMCLCSSSVSMSIHVFSLKSRLRYGLLIWNYNIDVLSPYLIYRLVMVSFLKFHSNYWMVGPC